MSENKMGASETDEVIQMVREAKADVRAQALERIEKIALAGYRMSSDEETKIYIKLLEAVNEADMGNAAFMATHKAVAKGKTEAYFNMAEACRAIRENNELGKGGEVGAIIRHDQPEAEPDQGNEDGDNNRGRSVEDGTGPSGT